MSGQQKSQSLFVSFQLKCGFLLDQITQSLNLIAETAGRPSPHKMDINETVEGSEIYTDVEVHLKKIPMNLYDKYFELCYAERIHEFSKIDQYKKWTVGTARMKYKSLDDFYISELEINREKLNQLRSDYKKFNELYSRYFNEQRKEFFEKPKLLLEWYDTQKESCNYCGINQSKLHRIVESRNGKLTLNQKTKRSNGTLEIEKLDPNKGYTFDNSVLSCPFCNNAKSNLISEADWRKFFVPAMKNYFKSILSNGDR